MREVCDLEAVGRLLVWDEQTYCSKSRARLARATSRPRSRRSCTSASSTAAYGEIVDELADVAQRPRARSTAPWCGSCKHDRDRAVRLPPELVRALAAAGLAHQRGVGAGARGRATSTSTGPSSSSMIALKIEQADALRDGRRALRRAARRVRAGHDDGASSSRCSTACAPSSCRSPGGCSTRRSRTTPCMRQHYPRDAQWEFSLRRAARARLRLRGRPPGPLHAPLHRRPRAHRRAPDDARRRATSCRMCVLSTIHEAGHGLYEQGTEPGLPAHRRSASAPSLGLHESQSRFYENVLGGSRAVLGAHAADRARALPRRSSSGVSAARLRARAQPRRGQRDPRRTPTR